MKPPISGKKKTVTGKGKTSLGKEKAVSGKEKTDSPSVQEQLIVASASANETPAAFPIDPSTAAKTIGEQAHVISFGKTTAPKSQSPATNSALTLIGCHCQPDLNNQS